MIIAINTHQRDITFVLRLKNIIMIYCLHLSLKNFIKSMNVSVQYVKQEASKLFGQNINISMTKAIVKELREEEQQHPHQCTNVRTVAVELKLASNAKQLTKNARECFFKNKREHMK